jgi:CheY-like chemotaxis protein
MMLERPTILIVDDEPFNLDYMSQELEDLGYQTVSATNGYEALVFATTEAPDLILLDVLMPGMDGFTVCRRLKEQLHTQLIPLIMMTALGAREDRIRGIEAGADDFLTKPVDRRELQARIQTAVKMKHVVDQKLDTLSRISEQLAKFVPEAVKRAISANPEAPEFALHEQDVSILFVDISGYTRLSELYPLDTVNDLDHIQEGGGDISETSGDGFMAVFQDTDVFRHARKAIETAIALLTTTEALNQKNRKHQLSIHMGANSGIALVGSTRFEGARSTRWIFSANGPMTNLAARLAEMATANQVLVGPETIRRVRAHHQFEQYERGKSHGEKVDAYRLLRPGMESKDEA